VLTCFFSNANTGKSIHHQLFKAYVQSLDYAVCKVAVGEYSLLSEHSELVVNRSGSTGRQTLVSRENEKVIKSRSPSIEL
jgi:hypothetical protein